MNDVFNTEALSHESFGLAKDNMFSSTVRWYFDIYWKKKPFRFGFILSVWSE